MSFQLAITLGNFDILIDNIIRNSVLDILEIVLRIIITEGKTQAKIHGWIVITKSMIKYQNNFITILYILSICTDRNASLICFHFPDYLTKGLAQFLSWLLMSWYFIHIFINSNIFNIEFYLDSLGRRDPKIKPWFLLIWPIFGIRHCFKSIL